MGKDEGKQLFRLCYQGWVWATDSTVFFVGQHPDFITDILGYSLRGDRADYIDRRYSYQRIHAGINFSCHEA